jgi:mono/diheme cytochrome c family protein
MTTAREVPIKLDCSDQRPFTLHGQVNTMKSTILAVIALAAVAASAVAQTPEDKLPPGDGSEVASAKCSTCHSLGRVISQHRTKAAWVDTVSMMTEKGLEVTPAEAEQIATYLTASFGPVPDTITPAATAPAAPTP